MSPNDQKTIATLQQIAETPSMQSKIVRFRKLFPYINQALQNGIPKQNVLEVLNANEFDLTLNTFNTYLSRERKARNPSGKKDEITSPSGGMMSDTSRAEYGNHDPRAIDALTKTAPNLDELARLAKKGTS